MLLANGAMEQISWYLSLLIMSNVQICCITDPPINKTKVLIGLLEAIGLGWIATIASTSSIRFSLVVVEAPNCDYAPSAQKN
jgi:hypothetical protein